MNRTLKINVMLTLYSPAVSRFRCYAEQSLGGGGNGTIHLEHSWFSPRFVFKKAEHNAAIVEKKVRHLLLVPPVAGWSWPTEIHLDGPNGIFVGFRCPLIPGPQLTAVVNPVARQNLKITLDFPASVHLASQLFKIHHGINRYQIYIGDVHGDQFVVAIVNDRVTGLLTGLDLDGGEIHARDELGQNVVYSCGTGIDIYLPPERHGQNRQKSRTPETEAFSVATLAYQILTDGKLPYQVRFVGTKPIPADQLVQRGIFPPAAKLPVGEEPVVTSFTSWPKDVQDIFCRMFGEGNANPSKRPLIPEMVPVFAAWADRMPLHRPVTVLVPRLPNVSLTRRQATIAACVVGGVMLCGTASTNSTLGKQAKETRPKVSQHSRLSAKPAQPPKLWQRAMEGN